MGFSRLNNIKRISRPNFEKLYAVGMRRSTASIPNCGI
jgi:hypothetical protein